MSSEPLPAAASPTSLSSDDSTRNLIEDLGKSTQNKSFSEEVSSGLTEISGSSSEASKPELIAPAPKKKAIKFTVRKVSHEYISSPDPNATNGNSENMFSVTKTAESNNTNKLHSTLSAENPTHKIMIQSQEKYDYYTKKIDKIIKEIEFLQNLLPPYNVEIDYPTRTKIYSAIEKLKNKQDELEKKKYALGITISRLWRQKKDDSDFWVRSKGME
mgnify:CR=1 FL=1